MNSTAQMRSSAFGGGERGNDMVGEQRAVRQAGQRVVEGQQRELLLEFAQVRQRLLEPAVLERDAHVVRERFEQAQVLLAERGAFAQPVADHQHADRTRLAEQAARSSRCAGAARPNSRRRAGSTTGPGGGRDALPHLERRGVVDLLHHARAAGRPQAECAAAARRPAARSRASAVSVRNICLACSSSLTMACSKSGFCVRILLEAKRNSRISCFSRSRM